jgi:hypothetical protein
MGAIEGYNVALWRDGEVVYELVSDLSEADILKMVQEQKRSSRMANTPRPAGKALSIQRVVSVP